jgi:hypothetical protein
MINELNAIAEYFLDDDGFSLSFRRVADTDLTFLWKLTIKIECSKVKAFSLLMKNVVDKFQKRSQNFFSPIYLPKKVLSILI